jgi:methionyl-tRNA formyltransferase
MFEKLSLVGRELLLDTLPDYLAGKITPQPQDETQVTFSPNITPEEERIDWQLSARDIFNQVRGMSHGQLPMRFGKGRALSFTRSHWLRVKVSQVK